MKRIRIIRACAIVLLSCAVLQACGAASTPTLTVAATHASPVAATATAATTATPTAAATSTIPSSLPPTSVKSMVPTVQPCEILDGTWQSEEWDVVWPMIYPNSIVSFQIEQCVVQEVDVIVFITSGMGFVDKNNEVLAPFQFGPDMKPSFSISRDNPYGSGAFSISGKFSSEDRCLGFIMFSKGFTLGSYTLPDVVTITFHAKPYSEFPM